MTFFITKNFYFKIEILTTVSNNMPLENIDGYLLLHINKIHPEKDMRYMLH
jgi:hypothetical protein